jgi:PAS domain S-box-containing protein
MKSKPISRDDPAPFFVKQVDQKDSDEQPDLTVDIFNQAPVGYCILNEKGVLLHVNPTALGLLKATREQVINKTISRLIFPGDQDTYYRHRNQLLETNQPQTYELRMVPTDGAILWAFLTATIVLEGTSALRYHLVITDISEHKKRQDAQAKNGPDRRLKKTETTRSVARLAGGIAHSFNNMLGIISGYTEMALQKVPEHQSLHSDLSSVKLAADRCVELTRQLLIFASRKNVAPQIVDVNSAIESKLRTFQELLPPGIRVSWLPGKEVGPVRINPAQFDQILGHLCENAGEAIAERGTITLKTENRLVDGTSICEQQGFASGEYVQISVGDDGCGIAPEILDHIFDPFFTTKKNRSRLGLGLATVSEALRQYRGHIDVTSTPGEKTLFTVFLPRSRGEEAEALLYPYQAPTVMTATSSKETILLVDDEPIILDMVARLLEHQGYTVLKANSAEEALLISDDLSGNIHLLLTDVIMPGINGDELAAQLLSRYPDLKCLFMSGYDSDVVIERGLFNEEINFIQKPFGINDILKSIDKALTGRKLLKYQRLSLKEKTDNFLLA